MEVEFGGDRRLDLQSPRVMGILNVTPDSFSDGGAFFSPDRALARAREMVAEGAALVDVGGESTRPGAAPVPVEEELARVIPVIRALAAELDRPVSVDTSKPEVMREAVAVGAAMINDVWALRRPGALEAAAELQVPVCLMHMQGTPETMQAAPRYEDVVEEVRAFLADRIEACLRRGIVESHILVDPGFGFGKTLTHNLRLLAGLEAIAALGFPVLVGISRKRMLGELTGRPVPERVSAGLAAAVLAVERGACLIRTHDVAPTVDALAVVRGVERAGRGQGDGDDAQVLRH